MDEVIRKGREVRYIPGWVKDYAQGHTSSGQAWMKKVGTSPGFLVYYVYYKE